MRKTLGKLFNSSEPSVGDEMSPTPATEDVHGAFNIDDYRAMRIAVIGAGASGIVAGIR